MPKNATTSDYYDIEDTIRETLIQAGFMPLDYIHEDDEVSLTERDRKILEYFEARGWDAFRIEPDAATASFTLARWSEDGIRILAINENGVEMSEATFNANAIGAAWAASVLYDA